MKFLISLLNNKALKKFKFLVCLSQVRFFFFFSVVHLSAIKSSTHNCVLIINMWKGNLVDWIGSASISCFFSLSLSLSTNKSMRIKYYLIKKKEEEKGGREKKFKCWTPSFFSLFSFFFNANRIHLLSEISFLLIILLAHNFEIIFFLFLIIKLIFILILPTTTKK